MTDLLRALALRGAERILRPRTLTTLGVRFPRGRERGMAGVYDHSLYDGAAGVGLVLLDLAVATGDLRHRALAEEVGGASG